MDNAAAAAYATNPQLPPSLVVFSQGGDTLSDVLTMQRTFNPQIPKDLHLPGRFGYPGHLLQHLQPHQFLHPALDPRLTFGTHGAFRPLSAFAPPQAKSLKTGPDIRAGCSKSLYNLEVGHEASSPDLSTSPLNHQEDESMSGTEEAANCRAETPGSERSTPEEGRGFRRRKQHRPDPACCPICGVTIRGGEFEAHYLQEVERLMKLSNGAKGAGPSNTQSPDFGPGSSETAVTGGTTAESRWETYQRVKNNRQNRLRSKHRSAKQHHRRSDEVVCPVCNEAIHTLPGSPTVEQLNAHVEHCLLQKQAANNEVDADIDVEGDEDNGGETYEEYEWAGQKRVRVSSLLPGGYAGVGMQAGQSAEDEEGDLVVDGDDTVIYGPPQFSDSDVRIAADGNRESSPGNNVEVKPEPSEGLEDNKDALSNPQIEALKMKIKMLESATEESKLKCLICMDRYRKPVISINCWHVHCEDCWLQTLGAKKLCPQCNLITSPSDLRRIYL